MSLSGPSIETERLLLRRFTQDDRDWLRELYADEDVTRYLGGVQTADEVDGMLRTRILDYYEAQPGLGVWMTIERATGARAGFHLLNHPYGESFVQIGFTLPKAMWGRGYATEMALAVLRYGFADLGLPRIAGIASLPNVASLRVLAKIGLQRRGERFLAHPMYAREGPMAWFERERGEWLAEWRAGSLDPAHP